MPDSLSDKLPSGQTADLGRTFYNDLVDRLNSEDRPGPVRAALSTGDVLIHPDSAADYPAVPGEVVARDLTEWGGMTGANVQVEWTLASGPGHLVNGAGNPASTVTTGPSQTVAWAWAHDSETTASYYDTRATRAWDAMPSGRPLPAAVEIEVVGKVKTGSASYTAIGTAHQSFQVRRAYDPDRVPGTRIQLRPSQEIAYLDGDGTAGAIFYDDSTFNDDATDVNRTVTAGFEGQPEGQGVTLQDLGSTEGETGNIDGTNDLLSNSDWRQIGVSTQATGELTLTAEYDVTTGQGTTTHTTKRRIQVVPAPDPSMESTVDPKVPAHELVPTPGRPEVRLGTEITVTSATETGAFFDGSFELQWDDARAAEVARRLDLDDLQVREAVTDEDISIEREQIELLNRAGTLLNAALGQATSNGLATYELQLENLPSSVAPGQVIRAAGAVFRVREVDGDTIFAEGMVPTGWSAPEDGRMTGSGKHFVVDLEAGYGTPGTDTFPRRTVDTTELVDPVAGPNRAGLTLPEETPHEATDGWHARYRVLSRWESGAVTSTGWTDWARAEPVPGGSPSVSVEEKSDGAYEVSVGGPAPFYGTHGWRAAGEVPSGEPDDAERALSGSEIPAETISRPPAQYTDAAVYFLEGHFRTEAGTSQPQVHRVVSKEVLPEGLPVLSTDSDQPPQDVEVPATDGAILEGPTRRWISVGGSWTPVGAGPGRIRVTTAQVIADGSIQGNTVRQSPTKWSGSAPFPSTKQMTIRFLTEGGVGSVEPVNLPAGAISFSEDDGVAEVDFGMQESFHGSTLRFVLRLVPSGGAAEERVVEYVLDDGSATSIGQPKIYSATVTGKGGTTPDDGFPKRPSDLVWKVEHSQAWTGLTANLLLKNVASVVDVRYTDGSDYDWEHFPDHMPPYVNLTSVNADAVFEVDIENAGGTVKTYTIDVIDKS
jgi:hypothetical protein